MTAYRPLVSDNNIRIKECTTSEYEFMLQQIAYLYSQNPSVTLSVVASNGNLAQMTDTRYRSGLGLAGTASSYPTELQTDEPELLIFTYDKIDQSVTTVAKPTYFPKPVRVAPNGLTEMTEQDVVDTFIDPVINAMVGATTTDVLGAGAYYISTSTTISGSTNLGTVYSDTKADLGSYTNNQIVVGGQQDHNTQTDYQLFQIDGSSSSGAGWRGPLVVDYVANNRNDPTGLRHMTDTEFNNYFGPLIRHAIYGYTGMTLRYSVDGSGTTQGTAITNTVLAGGTGNFQTYLGDAAAADPNDYRAQEWPDGTLTTANTHELKLERT